jgi:hypothetical protein
VEGTPRECVEEMDAVAASSSRGGRDDAMRITGGIETGSIVSGLNGRTGYLKDSIGGRVIGMGIIPETDV